MDLIGEYMEAHDLQTQDALDLIEEFSDEIAEMRGKCIDIGCGPGSVTRRLFLPKLPTDASVVGKSCCYARGIETLFYKRLSHYKMGHYYNVDKNDDRKIYQ